MAHDVFISHSSLDKSAADAVCAALETRGIRCWIAPRDIKPSDSWASAIVEAIRNCPIFLLILSSHANSSDQVPREVAQAASSGKQLLTLRIEDVQPEDELNFYLLERHWLDAMTPPFAAHLERLADACAGVLTWVQSEHGPAAATTRVRAAPAHAGAPLATAVPAAPRWWRRRAALIGAGAAVLLAVAGLTAYLFRPAPVQRPPAAAEPVPTAAAAAAPTPAPAPAPVANGNAEPREQIVRLTGSWSEDGFASAVVNRDIRIVDLYLKSGMKATTLHGGGSAILWGFQGMPQNGDPVELLKTFQANGFQVDDELQDTSLIVKLGQDPQVFDSPLAPKGYAGGQGGVFVGTLLFWIIERGVYTGPSDQDMQTIKYLIDQGADCTVPLAFLDFAKWYDDTTPYVEYHPMLESCAK